MQWSTAAIVELLSDTRWDIETDRPGGDVDTEALILRAHGAGDSEYLEGEPDARFFLSVYGFRVEGYITDPTNADVEMVVLTDGLDSGGGLNTGDAKTCAMYGELMTRLSGAGFDVVPTLDPYF